MFAVLFVRTLLYTRDDLDLLSDPMSEVLSHCTRTTPPGLASPQGPRLASGLASGYAYGNVGQASPFDVVVEGATDNHKRIK